ncbi:MAG: hypothetical protein OEZ06_19485 [Myxococcales bacterium]|nr:hypothetical protein [Myxococcales bacterium]
MGDRHNPQRYGETWPQARVDLCLDELEALRDHVVVSGGRAWHFMSPPGHLELKHAHDHKDIDLFVAPEDVATVVGVLKARGFAKVWTRYDKLPSDEDFRRYEKTVTAAEAAVRITIDFFVRAKVPARELHGYRVVEPSYLLGLYSNIHSSDKCFAVQAAVKLLATGIDPVGRPELVAIPAQTRS